MAVHPVIMPKLGAYTEDVLLAEWLVAEGQQVAAGGVVLELETEKTTAEVEADAGGFVHRLVAGGRDGPDRRRRSALIAETREEYDALAGGCSRDGRRGAADERQPVPRLHRPRRRPRSRRRRARRPLAGAPRLRPAPGAAAPLVSPRARALLQELGFTLEDAREIAGLRPGRPHRRPRRRGLGRGAAPAAPAPARRPG